MFRFETFDLCFFRHINMCSDPFLATLTSTPSPQFETNRNLRTHSFREQKNGTLQQTHRLQTVSCREKILPASAQNRAFLAIFVVANQNRLQNET